MIHSENYVYQKEVDWSVLTEGLTLPVREQVVFGQIMGRYLLKGEKKAITLVLNGKQYDASITNVKFQEKWNHKSDILQIRYPKNGDLAQALQGLFSKSYAFLKASRENRISGDRSLIKLPDSAKEYLAIYTTEYDDTYILETILAEDIIAVAQYAQNHTEQAIESEMNFDTIDSTAGISVKEGIVRVRKLNKKIGDNLKQLYAYRCQICGKAIGDEYDVSIAEAHHIDYFTRSLNNDASNQMIVCPNHHRIIHMANPAFDRGLLLFSYPNGYSQKLILNKHL